MNWTELGCIELISQPFSVLGIQNVLFIDLKRPERCTFLWYGQDMVYRAIASLLACGQWKYKLQQPTLDAVANFS